MKTFEEIRQSMQDKILVASHRGISGGNIPPNTFASMEIALRQGTDIMEIDLTKSTDGKLFVYHPGTENRWLKGVRNINKLNSRKIAALHPIASDGVFTLEKVPDLDDVFDYLKGKCYINLDKCWTCMPEIVKYVKKHNIEEQIILKSAPKPQYLKAVETYTPTYKYMPIFTNADTCSAQIEAMNINYFGAELVFNTENCQIAQDDYIEAMHKKGKILWGNAILFDKDVQLSAGHSDDISLTKNPNDGWGWLADKGFDIIQTDWTIMLLDYLFKSGKINKNSPHA